jgi:hypothetical protein
VDRELVEYLDRRFSDLDGRFDEIDRRFDELRRHFDVVAEQLMDKIQLLGEGVIGVDQKVDRLAVEMRTEFQNVDRRILHLQVRVIGRD